MYQIVAEYSTGDSFHTEEAETNLAPLWSSLERAKEALSILNTHHKMYQEMDNRYEEEGYYLSRIQMEEFKNSPYYDGQYPEFSVKVPLDDGTLMQIHVPYHGYFEHLYGLSIESINEDDGLSYKY